MSFQKIQLKLKRINQTQGFGYLIPPNENKEILGAVFDSNLVQSDNVFITAMIGDQTIQKYNQNSKKLSEIGLKNLKNQLNFDTDPLSVNYTLWNHFFPVFSCDHAIKIPLILESFQKLSENLKVNLI